MKKIFAFALALVMALSLAACGGKSDPKPSDNDNPGTSQQTPATTPDEDSGTSSDEVKYAIVCDRSERTSKDEYDWYTLSYGEFTFNADKEVIGYYSVFGFDTTEEAERYIESKDSEKQDKYRLDGTVVYVDVSEKYKDSITFGYTSLSTIEGLCKDWGKEYTVEER